MNLTEGLLVVVVLIVIYFAVKSQSEGMKSRTWKCRSGDREKTVTVAWEEKPGQDSPEARFTAEHQEYFATCASDGVAKADPVSPCAGDLAFATNEYGAPNLSYKDYVMQGAVDPATQKNHAEYIKDRSQGGPVNWTGRTYSPDSHDSYIPGGVTPMGILYGCRLEGVKMCNPTQVPDVDTSMYIDKPAMRKWGSS